MASATATVAFASPEGLYLDSRNQLWVATIAFATPAPERYSARNPARHWCGTPANSGKCACDNSRWSSFFRIQRTRSVKADDADNARQAGSIA